LSALAAPAGRADVPAPATLVVCAPGYPGSTAEAQPAMDGLAAALAGAAGLPVGAIAAVYHETEQGGVARLSAPDAAIALVPLQFFLAHERDLGLQAQLQAVPRGAGAAIRWSLVARRGRVSGPAALKGWTVVSLAGFSPNFVRGPALGAWGKLPAGTRIVQSGAVLSALRKAAAGEDVAVLLDPAQAGALPGLPFAGDLEVVAQSPPLPASIVATVRDRLPAARWSRIGAALQALGADPGRASLLAGLHLAGFVAIDAPALAAARRGFAEAAR
jgi:hypothetical protein